MNERYIEVSRVRFLKHDIEIVKSEHGFTFKIDGDISDLKYVNPQHAIDASVKTVKQIEGFCE